MLYKFGVSSKIHQLFCLFCLNYVCSKFEIFFYKTRVNRFTSRFWIECNYLIFTTENRSFLLLRGRNRFSAREPGSARRPGLCRAGSFDLSPNSAKKRGGGVISRVVELKRYQWYVSPWNFELYVRSFVGKGGRGETCELPNLT